MEIEEESKKAKVISENLTTIFSKEIEKLTNCLEEIKEEINLMNHKLYELVEKLEESLQQFELISFETEKLKSNFTNLILNINKSLLDEVAKIRNPNETLFDLIKNFYYLLFSNKTFSWNIFQIEYKNFDLIKSELDSFLIKEISKEVLDQCMPVYINNEEIKGSIIKVNKNFTIIADFIKFSVEYNIKRNMHANLYQSNLSKSSKLQKTKQEISEKETILKELQRSLSIMQNELTILVNQNYNLRASINLHSNLINKIFLFNDEEQNKPRVTIKLKGKFKARETFIQSILNCSKERNILIEENKIIDTSRNKSEQFVPNLQLSSVLKDPFKSREETSGYRINRLLMEGNTDIIDKYRTNNTTIFRDIEALESIIRDDRKCDIIPLGNATKPGPRLNVEIGNLNEKPKPENVEEKKLEMEEYKEIEIKINEEQNKQIEEKKVILNSSNNIDYYGYQRCNKNTCCK